MHSDRRARVLQGYFVGGGVGPPARARGVGRPTVAPARPWWSGAPSPHLLPAGRLTSAVQPKLAPGCGAPEPGPPPGMKAPALGRRIPAAFRPNDGMIRVIPLGAVQLYRVEHGAPLHDSVRRAIEDLFDADLATVRVHEGRAAAIGARAFTIGEDIYFAPGCYEPHGRSGLLLLGHELSHVLQQRAGRVANPYRSGLAIVQDPALESEAERRGRQLSEQLMWARDRVVVRPRASRSRGDGEAPAIQAMFRGFDPFAESKMAHAKKDKEERARRKQQRFNEARHGPAYALTMQFVEHPSQAIALIVDGSSTDVGFVTLNGPKDTLETPIDDFVVDEEDRSREEEKVLPSGFTEEVGRLRKTHGEISKHHVDDLDFCVALLDEQSLMSKELRQYAESALDQEGSSSEDEAPEMTFERCEALTIAVQKRLGLLILVADPDRSLYYFRIAPPGLNQHQGAYHVGFSQDSFFPGCRRAYYLPYKADRMTCLQLGDSADFFFTDLLEGCSLRIVGTRERPVVCHANIRSVDDVECKAILVQVLLDSATAVTSFSTVSCSLLRESYFSEGRTALVYGIRNPKSGRWSFYYWTQVLSPSSIVKSKSGLVKQLSI